MKKTIVEKSFNNISENAIKNINNVLCNIKERNPVKLRNNTPRVLVNLGVRNLPMYENPSHIRKNILNRREAMNNKFTINRNDHYHGLGKEKYISAINSLDNPRAIFKTKNGKDYIFISEIRDKNGNVLIIPIEIETKTEVNRVSIDINRIKTIYGKSNLNTYIKSNLNIGNITKVYVQKK